MISMMTRSRFAIRNAVGDDIPDLQAVERSAAQLFAGSPYPELVHFAPISSLAYAGFLAEGAPLFVAERKAEGPGDQGSGFTHPMAGFALCRALPSGLHLQELSVHGSFQRQGLGQMLLDHVINHARSQRYPLVSLTTYRDIPWNGPFYEQAGFEILPPDEGPLELKAILEAEIVNGASPQARCIMVHDLR